VSPIPPRPEPAFGGYPSRPPPPPGSFGQPVTVVHQHVYPAPPWHPALAALLSFVFPGAGQLYKGQVGEGIGWCVATFVGYMVFVCPGLVLHLICIINAATAQPRR
jgi:TM2 domain-containing membrane protein YozV